MQTTDDLVAEYLAKGGTITDCGEGYAKQCDGLKRWAVTRKQNLQKLRK